MALFSRSPRKDMDMLNGSLWDKLCLIAIPLALTGVLQQLFNAADVAVLGRFVSSDAMAAVGTDVPVIGTIVSLCMGLALGANVVVARSIGMKDLEAANRGVHTSFGVAVILGAVIALLGELLVPVLMGLLLVPEAVRGHAEAYLRVYLIGLPFIAVYNFLSAVYRSKGNTGVPLMALIAATLFNVAGNVFFVLTTDWGAAGVALATVLSNLLAAGILFFRQLRTTGILQLVPSRLFAIDRDALRAMVRIGLPAGIQGMVFSLSNILVQSAINSLGPAAMAGSVAGMTIEINVYCFINGFGLAATTFISQNYGARNFARCRRATWVSFWLNLAVTAVMVSIVILFARDLLRIFSDEEAVIALGVARIWYVVLPEFISVVMETTSDAMRGYGYSLAPAMVTLVAICSVRVIWVLTVFPANPTFERLMTVYPVSWAVTAVLLVLLYMRHQRSLRAKEARLLEAAAA